MTTNSPDGRDSMGAPPTQGLHSQGLKEDPSSVTVLEMNNVFSFLSEEKGIAPVHGRSGKSQLLKGDITVTSRAAG